jgi:hypothetical protein
MHLSSLLFYLEYSVAVDVEVALTVSCAAAAAAAVVAAPFVAAAAAPFVAAAAAGGASTLRLTVIGIPLRVCIVAPVNRPTSSGATAYLAIIVMISCSSDSSSS